MKFIQTLPYVALATAFVLPDVETLKQLALTETPDEVHALWDDIPDTADAIFGNLKDKVSSVKQDFHTAIELALDEEIDDAFDLADHPGHGHHGHHGHDHTSNLTIYQLISKSPYTTNFTKLVDEYDDIVELLNSTKANYTLFVPVDSAFAHLPDKKPSKEFVEAVVRYHIGLDVYSGLRILHTQTIPTALNEELLGGEPQRLRTSVGLFGIKLNFYASLIAKDFKAKNGVIHPINHILVPPPFVGRELSLFPNTFSTLLLAYEKTDFVKFIHGVKTNGTTVFAPSNHAFAKLGPRANAFLFNTEKGLGYLKALLKYQIVANATLYSDAYYDNYGKKDLLETEDVQHYDLTTLLHDLPIRVDIKRWGGWVRFWVNGFNRVVVRDAVARNGVIHVVEKVPIPPHKHHGAADDEDGEIDVEGLIERLADYVEDADRPQDWSDL
ncbi:fasciclin domain-containing protein [Coniochaeta ligniaria NRRL 30616]|uniref:Fasciclin domain-containing protein n=1 Tax=Coniochaeta ligniaria NRRL 30616 TaxID=1408157 RepID=A0A1J7I606_9PEZI|nr:fasciclin domain-containing protein [Coniochaeta ligniaria NRRL 30616]